MITSERFAQKTKALLTNLRSNSSAAKFCDILQSLDDWDLRRINPLQFAEKHGLAAQDTLDLFIHATQLGLFSFSWNLICPYCGSSQHSYSSINDVERNSFFCAVCNAHNPSTLDDYLEVAFTIDPEIHALQLNPYADQASYFRYFFSANFVRSDEFTAFMAPRYRGFYLVNPGEPVIASLQAEAGQLYRLISVGINSAQFIYVDDQPSAVQTLQTDISAEGFTPKELHVHPGQLNIKISNWLEQPVGVTITHTDFEAMGKVLTEHPPRLRPFLSGKMLLNNQTFRDLFPIQNLIPDLKLNVRSLTILFTDLKRSTDLYDRIGDVDAYYLIQNHFDVLIQVVRQNSGAVIKTMGDAVMATFSTPLQGVQASFDMLQGIAQLNERLGKKELGLKIGLHAGPALVVNSDGRLDYFGQSVNIAARVQGLADAGEICLTDAIYEFPEVQNRLAPAVRAPERFMANLKGVGESKIVYRVKAM
jgi:class 3 adenylate cyclase